MDQAKDCLPSPMNARSAASATPPLGTGQARPPLLSEAAEGDGVVEAIRAHLFESRFRTAQRVAREAASRFPNHPEVGRLHRALNERTASRKPASGRDLSEEAAWLRNPPESVRGRWVALIGSELVGVAKTLAELLEELRTKNLCKEPLVHRIG